LRIIAVGDLAFNGRYHRLLARREPAWPFRALLPDWSGADLRLGNLESPLATAARVAPTKLTLRGALRAADTLRAAGFDCVSLANNHAMDFGPPGLEETIERLDSAGILHHGWGTSEPAAQQPKIVKRRGLSVGMLAYCDVEQSSALYAGPDQPGVARFQPDSACRSIAELKASVDWVIVQIHWGNEMAQLPSPDQRAVARRLVEAGADLILGHHPHVLQPMELIHEVPVFFSLGNFLFSGAYWRGQNASGEKFVGKFRIHELSRETGWADVIFQKGRPTQARFRAARLCPNLAIIPEQTSSRIDRWDRLRRRLDVADYRAEVESEARMSGLRARQYYGNPSLRLSIELRLFQYGLIPGAATEV
jgi:poly-gamma-glutamate capsule biosynthesis protein CapA/YwtB (metallophosphatase superfamily)